MGGVISCGNLSLPHKKLMHHQKYNYNFMVAINLWWADNLGSDKLPTGWMRMRMGVVSVYLLLYAFSATTRNGGNEIETPTDFLL